MCLAIMAASRLTKKTAPIAILVLALFAHYFLQKNRIEVPLKHFFDKDKQVILMSPQKTPYSCWREKRGSPTFLFYGPFSCIL